MGGDPIRRGVRARTPPNGSAGAGSLTAIVGRRGSAGPALPVQSRSAPAPHSFSSGEHHTEFAGVFRGRDQQRHAGLRSAAGPPANRTRRARGARPLDSPGPDGGVVRRRRDSPTARCGGQLDEGQADFHWPLRSAGHADPGVRSAACSASSAAASDGRSPAQARPHASPRILGHIVAVAQRRAATPRLPRPAAGRRISARPATPGPPIGRRRPGTAAVHRLRLRTQCQRGQPGQEPVHAWGFGEPERCA